MIFDQMFKGKFKGFFAWGQNPACSGANSNKIRQALTKLNWMVNVNLFDNETGSFWEGPGMNPKEIKTEVFMLPCASSVEKEGSITNSGRWAQWRYKAVEPLGESQPDAEIMNELYLQGQGALQEGRRRLPRADRQPDLELRQAEADGKIKHIDIHAVAKEINGYFLDDVLSTTKVEAAQTASARKGDLVTSFAIAAGRRHHLMRQLDLLQFVYPEGRQRGQHDGPAGQERPDGSRPLPGLGLVLAGEPEDHLQPGLGRPRTAIRGTRSEPFIKWNPDES